MNYNGIVVRNVESWFKNKYGRLREVIQGKDNSIYITTSNKDDRENPDVSDDRIIRLIPR